MNIRAYTATAALIILAGLAATAARLDAQTTFAIPWTATQSSPAATFKIDSFGTLSETAPTSTSATFTFTGAPQLVWLPALGAFRAGSSFWGSQTNVGQYSAAFGCQTAANGVSSFAAGFGASASGYSSFAAGNNSTASGYVSTVFGEHTQASGTDALAVGYGSAATGNASMAFGSITLASNNESVATGFFSTASGSYSTAAGYYSTANSVDSFVVGQYNTGLSATGTTPNANAWVTTDPLFEVGNGPGTGITPKSDALVVYKNGNATLQGVLTAAPGGDIPMYTGQ